MIYTVGFTAAWGVLVVRLAATVLAVQAGPAPLASTGISAQTLAAFLTMAQDVIIGTTAAVGVAWASNQAPLSARPNPRAALRSAVQPRRLAGTA